LRSIAGNARSPISVTTAPTIPVAVAKTAQVMSVATASEAGSRDKDRCRLRNSMSMMLARSTMYPMNTNSGMAMSTSFVITQ
jgi:hypothetical protein